MAAGRLVVGALLGSQSVIFPARNRVARLAWNSRLYCSTSSTTTTPGSSQDDKSHQEVHVEDGFKDRFIPISRRSLVGQLMQQKDFLTDAERKRFEEFALGLDNAIDHQYHGVLAELKLLFDPVNPDKDTVNIAKQLPRRERLDNEFWLLQKLGGVMERANFHEIPKDVVRKALSEHLAGEGVRVSVNPSNYEVLHFWALGKHLPEERPPWYKTLPVNMFYRLAKKPSPPPVEYYRRVVVAVRSKGYKKLLLKMFKEIPTGALEQLLPDGKIKMSKFDQSLMASTVAIGSLTVLIKGVTYLADIKVQWTLIVAGITGLLGLRAWNSYKNRRTRYMSVLSNTLYFKNIANNRGLLTLLVDRSQDESFKEALLTYTFLLTNRPPSAYLTESTDKDVTVPATLGGMAATVLERKIENWVLEKTGATTNFECTEAVKLLSSFGMLRHDADDTLSVVNIDAAINALPLAPVSMATRTEEETELDDGYDQVFFETEDDYKKEEKKSRKTGWS